MICRRHRAVLMPGIMEHIERAGVHSWRLHRPSIPIASLTDKMMRVVVECSGKRNWP
ncbi:MAG: hypothetical protein ACLT9P_07850 [Evtepia gabavorous]